MSIDTLANSELHDRLLWDSDQPLRGEPFSIEHLETHARQVAHLHAVSFEPLPGRALDARLEENSRRLEQAYRTISTAVREGDPITPDAEWLIDNFYVVEDHLREIVEDLPPCFYYELPKIKAGALRGVPRVYLLALELIAHTDSELDDETIARFVAAYQSVAPLTIGELWAVPIMLRLGLVENLRRLADQARVLREHRGEVERILTCWREAGELRFGAISPIDTPSLALQLVERVRDAGPDYEECLGQLERRLAKHQIVVDDLVRREQQRQASNQVSIGNVITSMRLITALDWSVFFERTSLVDVRLRRDPSGFYRRMDFATRDRYRHAVEELAKRTKTSEVAVARLAVELAQDAAARDPRDMAAAHVGYYLIDRGRRQIEARLNYRGGLRQRVGRAVRRHPNAAFFGGLAGWTALFVALPMWYAAASGAAAWAIFLIGLLALLPASELAVGLMNYLVTSLVRPRMLPKLEFPAAIPAEYQTAVVIPAMLSSRDEGDALLERLEMHYLANPQEGLLFALLTDFPDAPEPHLPEDEPLIEHLLERLEQLNRRYATADRGEIFYFFHRERRWNDSERRWMGWERKRGKLHEFNRLLRGADDTSYVVLKGDLKRLRQSKYVITVDADTQIPHGAARRLVGAMAHPLNRPRLDAEGQCVTRGYSILQPRIGFNLASADRSPFAWMYASHPGIDPYATAVSDVYQDLFGEGSFTGKGIYDVEVFEQTLAGTFPENQILSHDLIEGCHARVGLLTDVELIDGFPARYEAEARRQHRWTRGDWQILPWLGRTVPTQTGRRRNPLSWLSRWKIFDNLRRSLVPPALLLWFALGWIVLPGQEWVWTVAGVAVLALPLLPPLGSMLRRWPRRGAWKPYLRELGREWAHRAARALQRVVFLPYKAFLMTDAVARTLWRLYVSRGRLLEWETAAAVENRLRHDFYASLRRLWFAPVAAVVLAIFLPAGSWAAAAPLLAAWFFSPLVSWWISRPTPSREYALSDADRRQLRGIARKTWAYFENFVTAEENWLPPDNYQEYPEGKIAHRVSPTNEGLYLASAFAAWDLGYVGVHDLAELLERNLATLEKLPRHRGHFYNWYDTTNLAALYPRYLSTVDSGNLAACFLTLAQGIEELQDQPLFTARLCEGLLDSLQLVREALSRLHPPGARFVSPSLDELESRLAALKENFNCPPPDLFGWQALTEDLGQVAARLEENLRNFETAINFKAEELAAKLRHLTGHLRGVAHDLDALMPWLSITFPSEEKRGGVGEGEKGGNELPASSPSPPLPFPPSLESAWGALRKKLRTRQTLRSLATQRQDLSRELAELERLVVELPPSGEDQRQLALWLDALKHALERGGLAAEELSGRYRRLAARFEALTLEMDFRFLYNPARRLFSIGFNMEEGRLDRSHYDMFASEARLASFLAIAKGDADARHWFQLGRAQTRTVHTRALLSWGGTMFEYLMPSLFTRMYHGSMLRQSCVAAVERQREFGRQHRVPWGVSESAFGALNASADYHYQSFGVPGLGLKRGLAKDLVISPYSTALAAMLDPAAALENFRHLTAEGADATWGYYDALDYTPERVPPGKKSVLVRCYMAHHHGMTLLALTNCLFDNVAQRRFHAHPLAKSTELLLQERVTSGGMELQPHADEVAAVTVVREIAGSVSRRITRPDTTTPLTHLISNGSYSVMVTNAGGGYSRWRDLAVTRWRSDTTRDSWGTFVYLRDVSNGRVWSAGHQPIRAQPQSYEIVYSIDKAEFRRLDGELETHMEITVSPERNAEVRQVQITNHGARPVEVELTSYAEVVLASQAADLAHPAFHKLFVQTEYLPDRQALIAKRRPRDADQQPLYAVHVLASGPARVGEIEWETDRDQFLGRGRSAAAPRALDGGQSLSGTVGAVLDPVFSLRARLKILPSESASLAFITAMADDREAAITLADQYHDSRVVHRTFELAWAQSQVELRHLHLSTANAHLYQRLASGLLYPHGSRRASSDVLVQNRQGQSGLWRYGVSGDDPIVLARVSQPEQQMLVRELLLAHLYWNSHGLKSDLVVLNEHPGGYIDAMQEQLEKLVRETTREGHRRPGGVYLLRRTQVPDEDVALLEAAASISLRGDRGSLARQVESAPRVEPLPPALKGEGEGERGREGEGERKENGAPSPPLRLANRYGGFSPDGDEYRIELAGKPTTNHQPPVTTPAPWSNVIANPNFGFLVTESGGGYTWARNSRENKLTTWSNDPVSDPPSEVLYVRDDQTGEFWSAMGQGADAPRSPSEHRPPTTNHQPPTTRRVAHGAGYSRFEQHAHELEHELLLSIAPDDPVKFICLKLRNTAARPRDLSLTYCVEWVLGVAREQTMRFVVTRLDPTSGALLATNTYHPEYPRQVAFLHVVGAGGEPERAESGERRVESQARWRDESYARAGSALHSPLSALRFSVTGDREEFFGRNGDWRFPAALARESLSGRVGAGLDPCGAVQVKVRLEAGEETEVVFLLGQGGDEEEAAALLARYGEGARGREGKGEKEGEEISPSPPRPLPLSAIEATKNFWNHALSAVTVRTPSEAFDLIVNRWLLYQTLSCRVWGRSAFYQSGGAYGYRDQLQDVMALVYSRPDITREQLLRAASRQFEEGDVQHWWHPPTGRGIRTKFSDDFLWLPFVTSHYLETTGDRAILDEKATFLRSPLLEPHEEERYELPTVTETTGTLYDHCVRAIDHGLRFGPHGIPLIGCGDWNDGMNKIGTLGQGESVWVGWFLLTIFRRFLPVVERRGDSERAARYREEAERLERNIAEHAWDGAWYRRAYFDDGTPLGSSENEECQIDSLPQSWAVIAGSDPRRAEQAVESAHARLVRYDDGLVQLFTPPFDKSDLDPGYIKGYLPGIRENGGQYTHAAFWLIQALALQGQGDRAFRIFDLVNPARHASMGGGETRGREGEKGRVGDTNVGPSPPPPLAPSPTLKNADRYKVEPYVVAADVYGVPPHTGRGGWTWYTGSASWMYRTAVESLLGFQLRGDHFALAPCIPADWPGFELTYRHGETTYHIQVENPAGAQRGVQTVTLDGTPLPDRRVPLLGDGRRHEVRVTLG